MNDEIAPIDTIENWILEIREQKVMLDRDLALLYDVPTKYLNQQVHRNILRFPKAYMFQLTEREKLELVANCNRFRPLKHSTSLPYAFTEHGVSMLASVLNSERAIKMSIFIINTFVRLRQVLSVNKDLVQKLDLLEKRVFKHDSDIRGLVRDIRRLSLPGREGKNKIGYV